MNDKRDPLADAPADQTLPDDGHDDGPELPAPPTPTLTCPSCGNPITGIVGDFVGMIVRQISADERATVPVDARGFFVSAEVQAGHDPDVMTLLAVMPLTFGRARLGIGAPDDHGFRDVWDYETLAGAVDAMHRWATQLDLAGSLADLPRRIREGPMYMHDLAAELQRFLDRYLPPRATFTTYPEPPGWYRHPRTRRYRPGGDPTKEYTKRG